MPLTDRAIRTAPGRDKAYKISDGGGLHLKITPRGSKLWRLKYRFDGREKLLSFGPYPLVTLKDAREKRDAAKRLLLSGQDPGAAKKAALLQAKSERAASFGGIAQEYLEKLEKEGRAAQTLRKLRWLIGYTHPVLTGRPVAQITAPEILTLIRKIEAQGTYETSQRLRSTIGSVFRYAIATGRAVSDPTQALKGALVQPQVRARSALIDPAALGGLLRSIDGFSGQPSTRIALQLLAILAPRPGELRHAVWDEVSFEAAVWRIPAARMKMRREHRVPLPSQALTLLQDLQRISGDGRLLFASRSSRICSPNTVICVHVGHTTRLSTYRTDSLRA